MWSFRNNRLLEPVDVTVVNLVGELVTAPEAKSQMVRSAIDTFVSGHTFSISELDRTFSKCRGGPPDAPP